MEAMVKGQHERKGNFPRIITCPSEMVAMSMADGYARLTNQPQCVIVHVDVGTQALGCAMHNASCGRAPVLVFAGLSPYTLEGEMRDVEAVRTRDRLRSALLSSVSHDLRTPLTSVLAAAAELRREQDHPLLATLESEALRLNRFGASTCFDPCQTSCFDTCETCYCSSCPQGQDQWVCN